VESSVERRATQSEQRSTENSAEWSAEQNGEQRKVKSSAELSSAERPTAQSGEEAKLTKRLTCTAKELQKQCSGAQSQAQTLSECTAKVLRTWQVLSRSGRNRHGLRSTADDDYDDDENQQEHSCLNRSRNGETHCGQFLKEDRSHAASPLAWALSRALATNTSTFLSSSQFSHVKFYMAPPSWLVSRRSRDH
jgi:hypothetical protein